MATGLSQPSPSLSRPPKVLTWTIGIVGLLFILAPMAVGFYTDWLWFGEVDFRGVFTKVIVVRIILFFVFALIAGFITWLAGYFTWRNRPDSLEHMDLNSPVHQYRRALDKSVRALLIGIPVVIALLAGFIGQGSWRTVMMFLNGESFGIDDPQFGLDLGFYAFSLPALRLIVETLSMLIVVAFLVALIGHYLLGSIKIGNQAMGVKGNIARPALVQLSVTAGIWMLLQVVSYWLDRYDLLFLRQDTFTGAGYTDIHAVLPAKIILMIIAVFVAIAFFSAIVLKDLRIPALAVVLMLLSSFAIGFAWPQLMERFSVLPNRAAKEAEYISRNIEATRQAYGLTDDDVTYLDNWGSTEVSDEAVAADVATISNIRLLDPEILSPTFTQMEQLRNFYGFPEHLSVDRYEVDGEMRDFVVAARELNPNSLRENQQDWINRHTVYTHGNGFIAAQANTVDEAARDAGSTRGGFPVFTVSDLQTNAAREEAESAEELGIKVDQPRIYFGPVIASGTGNADYAIVGDSGQGAVEYDTDTSTFTYDGSGGVGIGNLFNRTAFALRYQEMNFLLSDRVGGDSKVIFERDPRSRVEKVAPWLTTDSKTYPAVIDGRVKWIVDGYTTLSGLPYSQQTSLTETTTDALNPQGTNQRLISDNVGYIRNSVKATVDAYDGTVELYEFDTEDPVLKAWQGIFPDTVKSESEITPELREHLRYPEDLFKVQRELLARYHVDDPGVFFTNDAFWSVPEDPTAAENSRALNQPPYYVVAADPETQRSSFQLITPFRGLNRQFLAAHMAVSSDPETYGRITVRVLPTNTQKQGPKQAQDALESSDQVARDRALWQDTNDLHFGNLLTLPVGGGEILYAEPIYSQRKDQESAFPKLLRMLVSYKGRVGYAPTIAEALSQVGIDPSAAQDIEVVDGGSGSTPTPPTTEEGSTPDSTPTTTPTPPASGTGAEGEAIARINQALSDVEKARTGTNEEYGRALDKLDEAVKNYQSLTAGQ
ncbi:UPF0182 family protein [Corynebacterium testudinoris]|uniref:UPF0182 protein CTEST_03320 n=1 Tax=Corynebacterium testudinoris TaxID=136857 RepID=A0A0G3H427_9CORY|nr:UPF0182 family protein [Corynebacterium testudinoris]AKK08119.1 hypothetical protein CTEST_03320 [Corynebacterium testudinoris]MBX8996626.1 UPF0182 family protein [Corynebacterium testudinoris]